MNTVLVAFPEHPRYGNLADNDLTRQNSTKVFDESIILSA